MAAPIVSGCYKTIPNPHSFFSSQSKTLYFLRWYSTGGKKIKSKKAVHDSSSDANNFDGFPRNRSKNRQTDQGRSFESAVRIQEGPSNKSRAKKFKHILDDGYAEARRSVFVRTNDPHSTVQSLSTFGHVQTTHYVSREKQFVLAEYAREESVYHLLDNSTFFVEENQFPVRSRCLYDQRSMIKGSGGRKPTNRLLPLVREDCLHNPNMSEYPKADSLDEELKILCSSRSLNELDLRVRFLICYIIEESLQSVLPESRVIPYGSCLNGFGWWNSDLDMMLCLKGDPLMQRQFTRPAPGFKFFTTICNTERNLSQMTLTFVASLLKLLPRVSEVFKILNARVPIVKFNYSVMNTQCDISLEAMDSIKMTELLYLLAASDSRMQPLMSGIKQWAISHKLTSSGEQQKPTTIGLLTLLIFYLQSVSPPVLPTLRQIQNLANQNSVFNIGNAVYAFPANPNVIPKSKNTQSMESLLQGFFTFYANFDFKTKAISLIEGQTFAKPADSSIVYVENPLSIGLNICKNVNEQNLDAMKEAMTEAAKKIEDLSSQANLEESRLSTLFKPSGSTSDSLLIPVSELFDDLTESKDDESGEMVEEAEVDIDGNDQSSVADIFMKELFADNKDDASSTVNVKPENSTAVVSSQNPSPDSSDDSTKTGTKNTSEANLVKEGDIKDSKMKGAR